MKKSKTLNIGLVTVLFTVLLVSCRKEQPTLAQIKVVDVNGNSFADAEVRIFGEPTVTPPNAVTLDRTLYSDINGEVIFDFTDDFKLGTAGFAVLNIEINSGDSLFGQGIIKIEEEKLNVESVVIQLP